MNGFLDIVYKGEANPDQVDVDADEVETALRALLPSAYDELGRGILDLISTSYILREASMNLPDYSCHIFPVLRALEGVMRKLLSKKDFYLERRTFGEVLWPDYSRRNGMPVNKYIVKPQYRNEFNDNSFCEALELCYNHYYQRRHRLFHIKDSTDESQFIPTQTLAVQYIDEAIGIVEEAYRKIA